MKGIMAMHHRHIPIIPNIPLLMNGYYSLSNNAHRHGCLPEP